MKKYKLKKDTLSTKAGAIFTRIDGSLGDIMVGPLGAGGDISIEVDDINNFDEWFEEVKKFEEWRPKEGESYKLLYFNGDALSMSSDGGKIDQYHFSIGNCYPMDTPNELIIKEQKLIPQAMHRLKMAAKKAWLEFNGSEGPDWSNGVQIKFSIIYGGSVPRLHQSFWARDLGQIYFPTRKSCQAYIDNNQDDLKLLFGVE